MKNTRKAYRVSSGMTNAAALQQLQEKMGLTEDEINSIIELYGVDPIRLLERMQLSKYQFILPQPTPSYCLPCMLPRQQPAYCRTWNQTIA
jgi:hypothetical protein